MARKRMIDPSIWTDEGMAELTPRQQLLYIGLFSNADDDGRLKGSAAAIRLMLPTVYAGATSDEIEGDVAGVLTQMRQLTRYEVEGRQYFAFRNYRHWQSINRPNDSHLPPPPDAPGPERAPRAHDPIKDESPNAHASLSESDGSDHTQENRKEKKGSEGGVRAMRATPLPDDFAVTPQMLLWARNRAPDVDVGLQTERFENYWRGNGHRKIDWEATWRNWMLQEQERRKHGPGYRPTQADLNSGKRGKLVL
jgi:hypothetical protein